MDWSGAESVTTRNLRGEPVDLAGWWLRDSGMQGGPLAHGYSFPAGTVVPAGGSIVLHVGKGTNGGGHYHWGLTKPVFDNPSEGPQWVADGGYLFDPNGNLRAAQQYASWAPSSSPRNRGRDAGGPVPSRDRPSGRTGVSARSRPG